jgi:hypothetical protein
VKFWSLLRKFIFWVIPWAAMPERRAETIRAHLDPLPLTKAGMGFSEPDRPSRPSGPAPEPAPTGEPGRADVPRPRAVPRAHVTLALLQRRAMSQLFDHFGLAMIPAEAWIALAQTQDPVAAFRKFAAWVGCDPETVRRNDVPQLARMQTAIDLMVSLHAIRPALSEAGADRIRLALMRSSDAELAEQAHVMETLAAAHACRLRVDRLQPCASFERFAAIVDDICKDPLAATPGDAEEASIISDRLVRAMRLYADTRQNMRAAAPEIELLLAGTPASNPDRDVFAGILIRAEDLDGVLKADALLGVEQIEALAEECRVLLRDLLALSTSGFRADDPDHDDGAVDERAEALLFFGFPPDASPSQPDIKKVFRTLWKKHNVDDPANRTTDEQRLANEAVLKEINRHMSTLRGARVDVTA